MTTVRTTSQVLGVLALLLGVVLMHSVAGGHDAHTVQPGLDAGQHQMTDERSGTQGTAEHGAHPRVAQTAQTTGMPAVLEPAGVAPPCDGGCPAGSGLAEICLMVVTATGLLLLAGRTLTTTPHPWPAVPVLHGRRARTRPLRPPALAVLCISRT